MLLVVELALNTFVHNSTFYKSFYVNGLTDPHVTLTLPRGGSGLGGGEVAGRLADVSPASVKRQVSEFLATRLNVLQHVRDAMADSQSRQRENADGKSRGFIDSYEVGQKTYLQM